MVRDKMFSARQAPGEATLRSKRLGRSRSFAGAKSTEHQRHRRTRATGWQFRRDVLEDPHHIANESSCPCAENMPDPFQIWKAGEAFVKLQKLNAAKAKAKKSPPDVFKQHDDSAYSNLDHNTETRAAENHPTKMSMSTESLRNLFAKVFIKDEGTRSRVGLFDSSDIHACKLPTRRVRSSGGLTSSLPQRRIR